MGVHYGDPTVKRWLFLLAAVWVAAGCGAWGGEAAEPAPKPKLPNLRLDLEKKTIEIDGTFCLGEYDLELLVCQNVLRDYESLISSPCEPSLLHTALLALGLKPRVRDEKDPGKVLREGDPIDIRIRFTKDGKEVTLEPREFILNAQAKKHLSETPFVFFGSFLFPSPEEEDGKKMIYLADAEDWLIGVLGDTASVIDLPPGAAGQYGQFSIDPAVVPPKGTKATIIIRPAAARKAAPAAPGAP